MPPSIHPSPVPATGQKYKNIGLPLSVFPLVQTFFLSHAALPKNNAGAAARDSNTGVKENDTSCYRPFLSLFIVFPCLISARPRLYELPPPVAPHETETELQGPGVASATEHRRRHAASPGQRGAVALHGDLRLLVHRRVVVERAVGDGIEVLPLRLPHTGHVDKHKVVGVNPAEGRRIFGHHGIVHCGVEFPDLLLVGVLRLDVCCCHSQKHYRNKSFHQCVALRYCRSPYQ